MHDATAQPGSFAQAQMTYYSKYLEQAGCGMGIHSCGREEVALSISPHVPLCITRESMLQRLKLFTMDTHFTSRKSAVMHYIAGKAPCETPVYLQKQGPGS